MGTVFLNIGYGVAVLGTLVLILGFVICQISSSQTLRDAGVNPRRY